MENKLSLKVAYLMLFMTSLGWAMSTIIIKMASETLPAMHLMFGRFALASIIFAAFKGRRVQLNKKVLFHGSYLGIFLFLAYYLAVISLSYTTASKSGFLVALSVLGVPLVQLVIHKKRPNKWVGICVTMSLFGLYWISGLDGIGFNIGDAMAIGCSIAYTTYIMLIDAYSKEMNEDQMTFSILVSVTVISFFSAILFEGFSFQILLDNWIPIVLVSIVGTVMATYFQTRAQQVASPESVGIILLGEPLFTLLMALVILGERVTAMGLLGCVILLCSLLIAVVKKV